jgi:Protein of unknown function (DUF4232)
MTHRLKTSPRRLGAALIALSSVAAFLTAAPSAARKAAAASAPRCTTPGLVIWLDTQGNGTAGSVIYKVRFTNLSGHTCALFGYPGVSAVDLAGNQLGSSATRDHARAARVVTLRNGRSATAVLRIVDAGNFPAATCRPVTAAGLRVFPPNSPTSKLVPFPFGACAGSAPTYLFVRVVQR